LLEVLVVVGLVAVLTALVFAGGHRASEAGKTAQARTELAALLAALDSYRQAFGDYPRTDDPARLLQALIGKRGPDNQAVNSRARLETARLRTAAGDDPFASESTVLVDPWGRPYRYAYKSQAPWSNPACVLYSVGTDGLATETLLSGGFADRAAAGNADNLYADQP
jgi:type II secretory pathway pseudopilin PulG